MFRKIGEALGLSPTTARFTVAYLRQLHTVLEKNPLVTPQNVDMMVETVREISELVTWGDRHDNAMSEFFMERRMLERLLSYLEPARRTAKAVKVQILQTLSIFFTNLTNNTLVFYLLSNDRVNELITHRFDFHDEELMAYYISFLKVAYLLISCANVRC